VSAENPAAGTGTASKTSVSAGAPAGEEKKIQEAAPTPGALPEKGAEEAAELVIKPGDILSVNVYQEADLTKDVEVNRAGFINFPLIGKVKAEGYRKEEAEKIIRDLLEKDYLVNPLVSVKVIREPRAKPLPGPEEEVELVSYVLLGEVRKPGTYEFAPSRGKITLLRAVSIAGGFTNIANRGKIQILRHTGDVTKSFSVNAKDILSGKRPDEELQKDDIISVPESLF
jgi:polysaccharide export outer membrane protein